MDKKKILPKKCQLLFQEQEQTSIIEARKLPSSAFFSRNEKKAIQALQEKPHHGKALAKKIGLPEQTTYSILRRLKQKAIIKEYEERMIHGGKAKYYQLTSPAGYFLWGTPKPTTLAKREDPFLDPFIQEGALKSIIIVGSPDPHGPEKARARDGYYGMDFALFLGSFLSHIPETSKVKLDTEIREEDLTNNLIVIGGPVVNAVTKRLNKYLPLRFSLKEERTVYSTLSKKRYPQEEIGIVVKMNNPFAQGKKILVIAGLHKPGTKAAILSFFQAYEAIKKPNYYHPSIIAHVIEGFDYDSDGIVDGIEIRE